MCGKDVCYSHRNCVVPKKKEVSLLEEIAMQLPDDVLRIVYQKYRIYHRAMEIHNTVDKMIQTCYALPVSYKHHNQDCVVGDFKLSIQTVGNYVSGFLMVSKDGCKIIGHMHQAASVFINRYYHDPAEVPNNINVQIGFALYAALKFYTLPESHSWFDYSNMIRKRYFAQKKLIAELS